MFPPFESAAQFFPGLVLWCDPNCYEMDMSTLPPNTTYDRKKARELRPCVVVAVNNATQSLQVARLCATTPNDTRRWVRVDSPPALTWKLNDAWIWVGTPPIVAMVFNNHKAMHPHKDTYYSSPPVATANVQNYWIHRQNYLMRGGPANASAPIMYNSSMSATQSYITPGSIMYPSNPNAYSPVHPSTSPLAPASSSNAGTYPSTSGYLPTAYYTPASPQDFKTVSPQPVVVPAGFTERHPSAPGWWRNPATGWFWHASRGLLPPPSQSQYASGSGSTPT
ncbi:hypothetical protein B0H17DRAFT_1196914 [Mycena rosella]|uniref:Uncharacterized protein n=1 Tax=Mycena rosella TaxID=1033263 RepID=A0AAD7DSS7_MYCRO|nr:hypothetical protein B0H17DRAFT_1196914 [Mycena rosella]